MTRAGFCRGVLTTLAVAAAGTGTAGGRQVAPGGPTLFARGIVSTDAPEFAATFTPDGREVYFNRASADRQRLTIMTTVRTPAGAWSEPVVAGFSGTYRDVDPFVTPDGRRLYFSSARPRGDAPAGMFATWFVERTASGWGPPIDPGPPLNSTAGDVFLTAARDGTVVFSSSRLGESRVFLARESGGRWAAPVPLRFGDVQGVGNPAVAPSGRFMIVVMVPAGGSPDLFVTCRSGDTWSAPRALDAVNSPFADFAPNVDAHESWLSFTSERPGVSPPGAAGERPSGDIYRIALADAGVRCP